jgi:Fe2+ transport system protein FeoA
MLQLIGNKLQPGSAAGPAGVPLADLERGEHGILEKLDLPEDEARRLMELGFIPGSQVTVGLSAPGGDPRVFQVDGSEVALRGVTAARVTVRRQVPDGKV